MYQNNYNLNFVPGGVPLTIHISQYDVGTRTFHFTPIAVPGTVTTFTGASATLEATKPDGYAVIQNCTYNSDGSIDYTVQEQLAAKAGKVWSKLVLRDGTDVIGTAAIVWIVDKAGVTDDAVISDSDISGMQAYVDQLKTLVGTPVAISTAAGMTDTGKIYLYTGSETGYTTNHWYYYNGTAWVDGGEYGGGSVEVDSALSGTSENPVQNKVITSEITDLKSAISDLPNNLVEPWLINESLFLLNSNVSNTLGLTITKLSDNSFSVKGTTTSAGSFIFSNKQYTMPSNVPMQFDVTSTQAEIPGWYMVVGWFSESEQVSQSNTISTPNCPYYFTPTNNSGGSRDWMHFDAGVEVDTIFTFSVKRYFPNTVHSSNNLVGNQDRLYPVDLKAGNKLYITMTTRNGELLTRDTRLVFFDENKNEITYYNFFNGTATRTINFTPSDDIKYMGWNYSIPYDVMVNIGNIALPYEPYISPFVNSDEYALSSEVTALSSEVTALSSEVTALSSEIVFPPTFEIDLSSYNQVKMYGTSMLYFYSRNNNRTAIQFSAIAAAIDEATFDSENNILTIAMPGESLLLLNPATNSLTLQKTNWRIPNGYIPILYRYYASYGGLLFNTSFTRRFSDKVQEAIKQNGFAITQQYAEQIGHVVGAADYYRSSTFTKDFTMLMISDTHGDNEEISRAIDVCNNVAAIDCLFHLGDIGGQRTAAQITTGKNSAVPYIQNANPQKPFFFTMGNHDEQNDATAEGNGTVTYGVSTIIPYLNTASTYNERGYGYYDFPVYKIRMIILNSFDYPDIVSDNQFVFYEDYICWQEAQANFFVNTLSSTPSDYTVIVCSHWCELGNVDNTKINQHWEAAKQTLNNQTTVGDKTYMSDTVMSDIINAYKNRTSLSKSYSYTKGSTSVSYTITADFANANGTFAIWLAGHRHLSGVANSAIGNYLIYVNDTSNCELPTNEWAATYSNMPRSKSNNTRDLMTCLSIDTGNKLLKFTRIGAHINRFLDDENFLVLSY